MSSSSSSSSHQSSQSTNCINSASGDADDVANNSGTYPFTQTSITSSQTNAGASSHSSNSSTIQKTTNVSSTTFVRKSSRQVTPSVKRSSQQRSSQLSTYKEKMSESKKKRQKISSVISKSKKQSIQTTMTQCVPYHVDISHESTPTPSPTPPKTTTKETKVTIMKNASNHRKENRIFVGASVYSRSVGTDLEPLQPGKKKRLRKAMFGKVVESMDNNTYKVLFSNNTYLTLKSSQLTRAPDDPTFTSTLKSATISDINEIYDKVEENNDMSIVDTFHEVDENEIDNESDVEFDIYHSSSSDDDEESINSINEQDNSINDNNTHMPPSGTTGQDRIGGGMILIMDEHKQPLHYLCDDGTKLTIADADESNDQHPIVLDKYQKKKLEGKKELESCIGNTIEVRAGKAKSAE